MVFRRIAAAAAAGIVFCAVLSAVDYTPAAQRSENVLYYSFSALFAMSIVYVAPFFLFLGIPASIALDTILYKLKPRGKAANYLLSVLVYALGGAALALLLPLWIQGGRAFGWAAFSEMIGPVLLASMLMLHFSILLDGLSRRLRRGPSFR